MAVGWRERALQKNGELGSWYRGISTFVFNEEGLIQSYEGMFNLEAIKAAYAEK